MDIMEYSEYIVMVQKEAAERLEKAKEVCGAPATKGWVLEKIEQLKVSHLVEHH